MVSIDLSTYRRHSLLSQGYQWRPEGKTSFFSLPSTVHMHESWVCVDTQGPEEHLAGCSRHSIPSCFLIRSRDFCPAFWVLHLPTALQSFRKIGWSWKRDRTVSWASSTLTAQHLQWDSWPRQGDSGGQRSIHEDYHKANEESWQPPRCDSQRAGEIRTWKRERCWAGAAWY